MSDLIVKIGSGTYPLGRGMLGSGVGATRPSVHRTDRPDPLLPYEDDLPDSSVAELFAGETEGGGLKACLLSVTPLNGRLSTTVPR
jgi:hypothetical protein